MTAKEKHKYRSTLDDLLDECVREGLVTRKVIDGEYYYTATGKGFAWIDQQEKKRLKHH
jgi:hypothetical protein